MSQQRLRVCASVACRSTGDRDRHVEYVQFWRSMQECSLSWQASLTSSDHCAQGGAGVQILSELYKSKLSFQAPYYASMLIWCFMQQQGLQIHASEDEMQVQPVHKLEVRICP